MEYSFAPSHSSEPLRKALKCTLNLKKDVEEVSDEVTDQPCFHFHEFDISCLSKFVKIQKNYLHLLWLRFFAWSTPSPHHARKSFSKSFNIRHGDGKMTLQKLIISRGRNSLKFGVRHKSCSPHYAPEISEFHFFLTVCQEWKYFAIRTLKIGSQLSFDLSAGPIVRGWAGINNSLRLNARQPGTVSIWLNGPQSEILTEFPPKRSFKHLKNIRCLIRKVKRFQTLICFFNRESLCILQHRSVDDTSPLIKLPCSVLNGLNCRQSEILIKMPLKGSLKLRKRIRLWYRNVQNVINILCKQNKTPNRQRLSNLVTQRKYMLHFFPELW